MNENLLGNSLPHMSFEEFEECIPLDVVFDMFRDKAHKYYYVNYNHGEKIDRE